MTNKDKARAAAAWWAKAIAHPKFQTLDPHAPTLDDAGAGLAQMLATVASSKHRPTAEQLEDFEKRLRAQIEADLDAGKWHGNMVLSVDYGPDATLADVAEASGIHGGMTSFPWKTVMWIDLEGPRVRVRHGYHADVITIWPEETSE
jgi:hypothetical protein